MWKLGEHTCWRLQGVRCFSRGQKHTCRLDNVSPQGYIREDLTISSTAVDRGIILSVSLYFHVIHLSHVLDHFGSSHPLIHHRYMQFTICLWKIVKRYPLPCLTDSVQKLVGCVTELHEWVNYPRRLIISDTHPLAQRDSAILEDS